MDEIAVKNSAESAAVSATTRGLALETSGRTGSIALVENGAVTAEQTFSHGLKHAAGLLPLIDQLIRHTGWTPSSIQYLYVSHGPGSFTGLRIGVTLAKTLALVTGAKIVPVPSLAVLARNAPADARHVVVVLDAKRDQIFTARYEWIDGQIAEIEPAHLDTLWAILARTPAPVHLIGEGIPYHEKFLPADRAGIIITPEPRWIAQASVVAQLGLELARQGKFIDPDTFVPAYVRKPEAEEKYDLANPAHGSS
jgi:tRNA threonylcarbamoyladenosine biosynthesis protein TsaB